MDEVNVSPSTSPYTPTITSNPVSNNINEPSCIDIEMDIELSAINSPTPPSPVQTSPFPSRDSTDFEGFDGGDSVSAQLSPLLPFYPTENFVLPRTSQQQINWLRVIKVLMGITLILIVGLLVTLNLITKSGKRNLECKTKFTVSKDGKSDFRTVSEAVKASPSYSPHKVCIFVRTGDYHEMVNICDEKINIVLMGEGIGKTIISSDASIEGPVTSWPLATLRTNGKEFLAQDLTIITTAKHGVAVENLAENSIFFRCKLEGVNATLHIKSKRQFYRSCQLYGRNNSVFGDARAFFQKCDFFSEKAYPEEKVVFSSQSSHLLTYKSGFIFHLCAFYVDKFRNSSRTTFLGNSLGNYTSFVVMQSYLDASIGGYFLGKSPPNTTYYAIFSNVGRGATMASIPPFVKPLSNAKAASKFSLRVFLGGGNWIPPGVDYDLDLLMTV